MNFEKFGGVSKTKMAEISVYGPSTTWRAGRLDEVILLVLPKSQHWSTSVSHPANGLATRHTVGCDKLYMKI